jgi:hypothetical protein
MKYQVWVAVLATALVVGSCTVQKELVPTGGSRADGTVAMSFEYGIFEKPQVNQAAAQHQAQQRCAAWGYTGAEPFGGVTQKCQQYNAYGSCLRWFATVTYQCTGTPPASK